MTLIRTHDPFGGHRPVSELRTEPLMAHSLTVWPLDAEGLPDGQPIHLGDASITVAVSTTEPPPPAERRQAALETMGLPVDTPAPQRAPEAASKPTRTRAPRRRRATKADQ